MDVEWNLQAAFLASLNVGNMEPITGSCLMLANIKTWWNPTLYKANSYDVSGPPSPCSSPRRVLMLSGTDVEDDQEMRGTAEVGTFHLVPFCQYKTMFHSL